MLPVLMLLDSNPALRMSIFTLFMLLYIMCRHEAGNLCSGPGSSVIYSAYFLQGLTKGTSQVEQCVYHHPGYGLPGVFA